MMPTVIPHQNLDKLQAALAAADGLTGRVATLLATPFTRIVLTTSFGLEDQVLTHAAAAAMAATGGTIHFATLDTGRLFPETYEVWSATERRYGIGIACLAPDGGALRQLVAEQGVEGFRDSIENRKACCATRKVVPLRQALQGADLWITGLRADQSQARAETPFVAWDGAFGVLKASPLADWSREDAARFAQDNDVPVSRLHAQGFLSIGCAPCTRAVAPGEPERAGRWWWEDEGRKECGLHGRFVPAVSPVLETA